MAHWTGWAQAERDPVPVWRTDSAAREGEARRLGDGAEVPASGVGAAAGGQLVDGGCGGLAGKQRLLPGGLRPVLVEVVVPQRSDLVPAELGELGPDGSDEPGSRKG